MKVKNFSLIILFLIGITAMFYGINSINSDFESLTGSFTEAEEREDESAGIENIYWEFEDGRVMEGRVIKRDLEPGKYNVTLKIEKTNGETDTYERQIEIE